MSSIFACDLGLNRKTLSRNFFCCFVFRFWEIFFNQHWRQMRASLILLFGKTKAFFGKDTARKKTAFLHTLFVENERETSRLKWGAMFFYKVEGTCRNWAHLDEEKNFGLKSHLRACCTQPFNYYWRMANKCCCCCCCCLLLFYSWILLKIALPLSSPLTNVDLGPHRPFVTKQHCLGGSRGVKHNVKANIFSLFVWQMNEKEQFLTRCHKDFCWRL